MINSFEDNKRFQEIMSRKAMEEKRCRRGNFGSDDSEDESRVLESRGLEARGLESRGLAVNSFAANDIYAKKVFTADLTNEHCRRWEQMFQRLLDYRKNNGHCLVPNRYAEDPQLGAWVATQRRLHKLKMTKPSESTPLTDEREKRLVEIGFEWSAENPRCVPWETRFVQLLHFVVENGHAQVPIGWEQNVQLANWVSMQRQEYKSLKKGFSTRLTQDRIDLLNRVGFVWEAKRGGPKRLLVGKLVPNPDAKEGSECPADSSCYRSAAESLLKVFDNGEDTSLSKSNKKRRASDGAASASGGVQKHDGEHDQQHRKNSALQFLEAENDGHLAALAARGEIARLAEAGALASARNGAAGGLQGMLGLGGNSSDMTAAAIFAGRNASLLSDANLNSRLSLMQQLPSLHGNNALQQLLNRGGNVQAPLSSLSSLALASSVNTFPSLAPSSAASNLLPGANPFLQQHLSRLDGSVERAMHPPQSSDLLAQALLRSSLGGRSSMAQQSSSQVNQALLESLSQDSNPLLMRSRERKRDADNLDSLDGMHFGGGGGGVGGGGGGKRRML